MKNTNGPWIALLLAVGCGHAAASRQAGSQDLSDRILAPVALDPAIEVKTDEVIYDVHGPTPSAARAEMNQRRPVGHTGPYDALTKWFVSWRYRHLESAGSCRLAAPRLLVTITTTLPRWDEGESTDHWQRYMAGLLEHERGHAQNARAAAQAVYETLEKLPPSPSCRELDERASRDGKDVIHSFTAEDDAYDQRTRHGKSQGASFP
jgi:predicted secreted Zn-dependent protease